MTSRALSQTPYPQQQSSARKAKARRGFILIELLIAVAIIAVLAAIAVLNFLEMQIRAKVARTKSDFRVLATAFEAYAADHNSYPPDWDSGVYWFKPVNEGSTYARLTTPVAYITSVPLDLFRPSIGNLSKGLYYEFYGGDVMLGFASQPFTGQSAYWANNGVRWCIGALAPDRLFQSIGEDLINWQERTYDPTNGTVSLGDIGCSNVRSYW